MNKSEILNEAKSHALISETIRHMTSQVLKTRDVL